MAFLRYINSDTNLTEWSDDEDYCLVVDDHHLSEGYLVFCSSQDVGEHSVNRTSEFSI